MKTITGDVLDMHNVSAKRLKALIASISSSLTINKTPVGWRWKMLHAGAALHRRLTLRLPLARLLLLFRGFSAGGENSRVTERLIKRWSDSEDYNAFAIFRYFLKKTKKKKVTLSAGTPTCSHVTPPHWADPYRGEEPLLIVFVCVAYSTSRSFELLWA